MAYPKDEVSTPSTCLGEPWPSPQPQLAPFSTPFYGISFHIQLSRYRGLPYSAFCTCLSCHLEHLSSSSVSLSHLRCCFLSPDKWGSFFRPLFSFTFPINLLCPPSQGHVLDNTLFFSLPGTYVCSLFGNCMFHNLSFLLQVPQGQLVIGWVSLITVSLAPFTAPGTQ